MNMIRDSKINNWGTALGVRIPAEFAKAIDVTNNSAINIVLEDDRIVIMKSKEKPKRRNVQALFAEYPEDFIQEEELDWGNPVGNELW